MNQSNSYKVVFCLMVLCVVAMGVGCGNDNNPDPSGTDTSTTDDSDSDTGTGSDTSSDTSSETETDPEVEDAVNIANAAARSCELLFAQGAGRIDSVQYGDDTKGAVRYRNPNAAVAVSRSTDTPFEADSVILSLGGTADEVTLTSSRCFDSKGTEIDGQVSF